MATIDTNMSLVMIDPNEPLELYDGTIIKGRLEWFLYALCCLDYGNLPTPLSRIEEWANALITNELPNMEPQSRAEEFFKAILTGDTSNLPTPQSRSEVLLDKLARGENDFTNVEKIQSRYEFLLAYLIKNGGGIGNIDYVLYKFQKEDETLYNTKERPVKSAILKGQTLVNLSPFKSLMDVTPSALSENSVIWYGSVSKEYFNYSMFKPNTKYIVKFGLGTPSRFKGTYISGLNMPNRNGYYTEHNDVFTTPQTIPTEGNLYLKGIDGDVITKEEYSKIEVMIIEYQQGMENWDIPYFEGMQSVKMPVLTTTGKNLFGSEIELGGYIGSTGLPFVGTDRVRSKTKTFLKKGTYTLSCENATHTIFSIWNTNNTFRREVVSTKEFNTFTFDEDVLVNVVIICEDLLNSKIQIEEGSVATSYEPYKTNILSTSEDLELRGIGEVQDTLDCLTGEVTERIGEIVFDGTTGIVFGSKTSDTIVEALIYFDNSTPKKHPIATNGLSDKAITVNSHIDTMNYIRFNTGSINYIIYGILTNQLETVDVNGVKKYLQSNPVTIQYQLETESIKTVDLTITDQGGATIPKLKTFDKITHVNVSATDILPGEVEMEVATTIGEDLSGTSYSTMEDIETKQEALKESNNAQTESVNSTMMATTEIYESLL